MEKKVKVIVCEGVDEERIAWLHDVVPAALRCHSGDTLRRLQNQGLIRVSEADLARVEKRRHQILSNPPHLVASGRRGL